MRHCHCKRCGAIFPETESFDIVITLEDDDTEEDNQALLLFRSCAWCGQKFDEMAETYSFPGETYRPPNEAIMNGLNDANNANKTGSQDIQKASIREKQLSLFDTEEGFEG